MEDMFLVKYSRQESDTYHFQGSWFGEEILPPNTCSLQKMMMFQYAANLPTKNTADIHLIVLGSSMSDPMPS